MKAAYLLGTAYAAGFLGREDGKRPSWFDRAHLMPVISVTPDMQEHLANACHVICLKVRQEVSSDPATKAPTRGRPPTAWQSGIHCGRVLWRALFAAAAAKAPMEKQCVPLIFMVVSESLRMAARDLLTKVWNEVQVQFTSRCTRYRNMRSRPQWSSLEALQFAVFASGSGFGISDPSTHAASSVGSKPASSLQDFMEEILALRFVIDWLSASIQDGQDFLEHTTKRIHKRPPRSVNAVDDPALPVQKERSVDSFAMMWTDDKELRSVATLAMRLFDGLEGPAALQLAATFAGQMVLAILKGVEPLLAHLASMAIARTAESHAQKGTLPPVMLPELDEDVSFSTGYHLVTSSFDEAHGETQEMVKSLPRGVLGVVLKVQATWRGYIFRSRHFARAGAVAAYCKAVQWPVFDPNAGFLDDDDDSPEKKKKRKKTQKVDATKLNETITDFEPKVSKYLGGDPRKGKATSTAELLMMRSADLEERRSFPLPTADHRACADLFALYVYNMHRRKELVELWKTLCGCYERGMDAYAELLNRNPALRPMLDSIAAQLKRGTAVGLDRALVAKRAEEGKDAVRSRTSSDADLFTRRAPSAKSDMSKLEETSVPAPNSQLSSSAQAAAHQAATQLPDPATLKRTATGTLAPTLESVPEGEGEGQGGKGMGDYLTNYLKEMDGDDSQFKDIDASVVPLSTGTSPPRVPPHEHILQQEMKGGSQPGSHPGSHPGSGQATPTGPAKRPKPKLDVPFCIQRCKPIWLPIKAHRFAAYRAKVLQLLPQRVLQQYIDFEKQGQYAACIKLLESASPGSLNVLSPATLVNNKPLLVETVLQLIVGYSGLCLRNQQGQLAVKLVTQVIDQMSLSLRDLHPQHRTVLEAYLYDTALSVCYYMPNDYAMSMRADAFFQQAAERYLRLEHTHRYCKCCLRGSAVFHQQGARSEAEYYTQQALKRLSDAQSSSMLAVCHHNLACHTIAQNRLTDAVSHVKAYVTLLRMLPKLGASWMQLMDNTQWLVLKAQELWPAYASQLGLSAQPGSGATKSASKASS